MTRLLAPALLAATGLALTACGSAPDGAGSSAASDSPSTATVAHAQGSLQVPVDPDRMVVLDFGALDTVTTLGAARKVVGVPSQGLPAFLPDYRSTKTVGTMQEPDVEAIAALEPDVIVIGGRSADAYAELSKIAPTIDLSAGKGSYLEELKKHANALGAVVGKPEQAAAEVTAIEQKIASTKAAVAGSGTALTLLTSGGKLSAFGPGSRFGLIHDVLGVKPAAANLKKDRHGQAVSFEFVAQAKPENLLVIDRDAAIGQEGKAAQQVLDNALVASTPAWKAGRVDYLDGQRWYLAGTGLTNVRAMIDEIEKALQR